MLNLPKDMPLSMKLWLATDEYDAHPDPDSISASTLLQSFKQIILKTRVKQSEVLANANTLASARIGQAIHTAIQSAWEGNIKERMMEIGYPEAVAAKVVYHPTPEYLKAHPDAIPVYMEVRSSKVVNGFTITGQFDFVLQGRLEDFKSTSTYTYQKSTGDKKYILQGSIYRWLNQDIITNDQMAIQYIFTNWVQSGLVREKNYPASKLLQVTYELMSLADTERFIKDKVTKVKALWDEPEDGIPDCTNEDLWRDPPTYKYYKNPLKKTRSTKNFDNLSDALQKQREDRHVGDVDTVQGKPVFCKFCAAAPICKQKDIYILDGSLEL